MNLLLPIFLGAALLVGLPLLLHLLRIQPRQQIPFPSLTFLGLDALRDSNRHRIRRWLIFLLRCMLILTIVVAFCRPYWNVEHAGEGRAVVVVVDNSYSMQVEGRLAEIQSWLSPQLAALRPADQLGVLVLHPTPTWLVPLSDDLEAGRNALGALPKGYETTRYRAGIQLAGAKLAHHPAPKKQIWLAADEQRIGWKDVRFDQPLPGGVELLTAPPHPAPKRQAAVVALKAARTSDGRVSFDATVRNFSTGSEERVVTFFARGEKLGTQRCVLADGRAVTVHADFAISDLNGALMLHATIDADELPVDDTAYAALAPTDDRRVMLSGPAPGEETDFLAAALRAVRDEKLPVFRVDPFPPDGADWEPASVAVLRGPNPFRAASSVATLERFLAAGGSAWVICDGTQEQKSWLAKHGITVAAVTAPLRNSLTLRDLVLEHSLFASFAGHSIAPLLSPRFSRGWSLQGEEVEPLARWGDRTVAIAEVSLLGGRLLLTGFGAARSDSTFPVEAGYVPFVHQAVNWLAQRQSVPPGACRVSETLVLPGSGIWHAVLSPERVPPVEVHGHITPTAPGIYAFEQPDRPRRFYAVNLDTAESDLTPWPTPEDFSRLVGTEKQDQSTPSSVSRPGSALAANAALFDERHAWWWLLVAAIVLLVLELAIANRTVL